MPTRARPLKAGLLLLVGKEGTWQRRVDGAVPIPVRHVYLSVRYVLF